MRAGDARPRTAGVELQVTLPVADRLLRAARAGQWKAIQQPLATPVRLYNLAKDPQEQNNVAESDLDKCRRLRQRLAAWKDHVGRSLAVVQAKEQ